MTGLDVFLNNNLFDLVRRKGDNPTGSDIKGFKANMGISADKDDETHGYKSFGVGTGFILTPGTK